MSAFVSVFIFVSLLAVSGIHMAWAFGSTFPALDEKALARTVAGFRGIEKMPPPAASAFVSLATFASALWPHVMSGQLELGLPSWFVTFGGVVLTLVFLGRGVAGFTPWFKNLAPEQPFARLNQIYYSPFCTALGASFLWLTLGRLI
jgi:Protein of unknown function (DUF3995)